MPTPKKAFNQPRARSNNTRHQNAVYPKPAVPVAVGNFLPPRNVSAAGLEVVVSYPSIKFGDVIALKFNGDDSFVPITVKDQKSVSFWVSVAHIIRALGTDVEIQYTLGGDSAGQRSEILQLTVLPFMEGDLEMALVKQATPPTPGLLDLNTFSGDADIEVAPWPLIATGQTVWLDLIYKKGESNEVLSIISGEKVNTTEVSTGVKRLIAREVLDQATSESTMRFPLSVNLDGTANRNDATQFSTLELVVRQKDEGPTEWVEDFEIYASGVKPSPFKIRGAQFYGGSMIVDKSTLIDTYLLAVYLEKLYSLLTMKLDSNCSRVTMNLGGLETNPPVLHCYYDGGKVHEEVVSSDWPMRQYTFEFKDITSITFINRNPSVLSTLGIDNIHLYKQLP